MKDEMDGVLIALEGTEPSITETQLTMLADNLRSSGHHVVLYDFPRRNQPSSYFVQEYLSGSFGSVREVGPYRGSLFYALDHYHTAAKIRQDLGSGKVVLVHGYSGSSMAEQGLAFAQPEERRGFFIWLEELETRMFDLPRPMVSIVLRTSASTSSDQIVEAYDDLCKLFPKDYWRLDCVRGKARLPAETIHALVLSKLTPLLPRPRAHIASSAAGDNLASYVPSRHDNTTPEHVSSLDACELRRDRTAHISEQDGTLQKYDDMIADRHYRYYIPDNLNDETRKDYTLHMDRLFALYGDLAEKLFQYLVKNPGYQDMRAADAKIKAFELLNPVLPVAILTTLHRKQPAVPQSAQTLKDVPESVVAGLGRKYLADMHSTSGQSSLSLVAVLPRNEMDVVPDILYRYSALPLQDIRAATTNWPYAHKAEVLQAYIHEQRHAHTHSTTLVQYRYTWDVISDYVTFRDLLAQPFGSSIEWQLLTPRFGFEMPDIIEAAGLMDDYEECFAISLKLHSLLQQAGYTRESQYATLLGHKMRWHVTYNASEIALLIATISERIEAPRYASLLQQMQQEIADYHPMLAEGYLRPSAPHQDTV